MITSDSIFNIIQKPISGEWGKEPNGVNGTKVIRTTNFTNTGKLDIENKEVVKREIDPKKIENKKLVMGDIIIEKSGGSPTQPVGRVVYFDVSSEEPILCNNFTSIIRVNSNKVFSKYLFYFMFYMYQLGVTKKYQNKTTGIINLKLDSYLKDIKIPLPKFEEQKRIVEILDKAQELIKLQETSLDKYIGLESSLFNSMFGSPISNEKQWKVDKLSNYVESIESGWSPKCENRPATNKEWGILKLSAVTKGYYLPNENKAYIDEEITKLKEIKEGDVLVTRKNTKELVGACAYVFDTREKLATPDLIFTIKVSQKSDKLDGIFLWKLFNHPNFKKKLQNQATGSSGSMPNISKKKLMEFEIIIPPINYQRKFKESIIKIHEQKIQVEKSLNLLEENYQSLLQQAFKGELTKQKVR